METLPIHVRQPAYAHMDLWYSDSVSGIQTPAVQNNLLTKIPVFSKAKSFPQLICSLSYVNYIVMFKQA